MNYKELFEKFWNKEMSFENIPNKERTFKRFKKLYENVENEFDIYDKIDTKIINHKSQNMKKIQLAFYKYLEENTNFKCESILKDRNLEMDTTERRIDILKNSHGEFNVTKLSEDYSKNYSTISDDLDKIGKGISFLDTFIKPRIEVNGTKRTYEDTVHPIFLALNLTEVNTFLKILPELLEKVEPEDTKQSQEIKLIKGIIERMQMQLSDYAQKKIGIKVDTKNKSLKFISEKELTENEEGKLCFLSKGMTGNKTITLNGIKEYYGRIIPYEKYYAIQDIKGEIIPIQKDDNISYKTE